MLTTGPAFRSRPEPATHQRALRARRRAPRRTESRAGPAFYSTDGRTEPRPEQPVLRSRSRDRCQTGALRACGACRERVALRRTSGRGLFFLLLVFSRHVLHACLWLRLPGSDPVGSGLFRCGQRPARRSASTAQRIDESRQAFHAKTVSHARLASDVPGCRRGTARSRLPSPGGTADVERRVLELGLVQCRRARFPEG